MRVIAGSARRLLLKTVEGMETRPTTDRIKETLFNMISAQIPGCNFLDLFSGSGAIGIEALSRGAKSAVMIENNPKAVDCIRENLTRTRLLENAKVMNTDALSGLKRLEGSGQVFDIVFMDPPYNQDWEKKVLSYLADSSLIDEDTLLIIEASKETDFGWLDAQGYCMTKSKEYKTNKHVFANREE